MVVPADFLDARGHTARGGERRRPATERHLVFSVVADGDNRATNQPNRHPETIGRSADDARRHDIFLRRRCARMLQAMEQLIERDAREKRRTAPVADGAARNIGAGAFRRVRSGSHDEARRPIELGFRLGDIRIPRPQRRLARTGGRIHRGKYKKGDQACRAVARGRRRACRADLSRRSVSGAEAEARRGRGNREHPSIGHDEVDAAQKPHGNGIADERRQAQRLDEDLHQNEVADDRYEPSGDVEPNQSTKRLGPSEACEPSEPSIPPRPPFVPHEVVQHRRLHRRGGRGQPRPPGQRGQHP